MTPAISLRRRGAVATLAMMYLTLLATLSLAMYVMATLNTQTAENYSDADKARASAESGLRWIQYRFCKMARPKTLVGKITPDVANNLWPSIRTSVTTDLNTLFLVKERPTQLVNNHLLTSWIGCDETAGKFQVDITQDAVDRRFLVISSTGQYRNSQRTVSMKFLIDKKIRFAIAGRVPIQIGRNTLVEGPIAMVAAQRMPPLIMLSDFRHLTPALKTKIDNFNDFLEKNHTGLDNRITDDNPKEYSKALSAGYSDYNNDGAIDEYDLFVREFDRNGDRAVDKSEFTNPATGKLYDPELFAAIDSLGGPKFPGDDRLGYQDGIIDNQDGYAKIRGNVSIAKTAKDWQANEPSGTTIHDTILGPTASTSTTSLTQPIQLGADGASMVDLNPANFADASLAFKSRTGAAAGPANNTPTIKENLTLSAAMANGGSVVEQTPYGSISYEATYTRPVFRNMVIKNCIIPKGLKR
jgi:hypothetical protein